MLELLAAYAAGRDGRGMQHLLSRATTGPPWQSPCNRQLFVARAALRDHLDDALRCSDCIVRYKERTTVKPPPPRAPGRVRYTPVADPPRFLSPLPHPQPKE